MSFDNKIVKTMYFGNGCGIKSTHSDSSDVVKTIRALKPKTIDGVSYTNVRIFALLPAE